MRTICSAEYTTNYAGWPPMESSRKLHTISRTREEIGKALATNFKGEKYIKPTQLEQLLTTTLVHEVICDTEEHSHTQETLASPEVKSQIDSIKSSALRLLAMCIWSGLPLRTFRILFNDGFRDKDLPLKETVTHALIEPASWKLLLEYQSPFIPYSISDDGNYHIVPSGLPLPILFEDFNDRIGHGSFSEVFKVQVDSEVDSFCQTTAFALKRLKPSDDSETIFHCERLLLEELRKRPHDHIVTHLTSIMDQGTFYILFPLAECNLRTFLNRVTAPPVHRDVVLWFFSQLKGLADAVLHLHSLRDSMSKGQTDSSDEFIQSLPILHGDIKPENILVFPSTSEASLGIMKLTDFGSALTNEEEQRSLPLAKIQTRGTKAYECPNMLISSEASYKTDIWSLSCVFLELLDWLFYPPGSEEIGFMTQRSIDTLSCSSSFWRFKENGEVELKKSVDRRLYDLERPCTGRLGLEYLLALLWDTFLLQKNKDLSAQRVLNEIGRCISQAELDLADDPNFYIDPTPRMREEEAKRMKTRVKKDRHPFWRRNFVRDEPAYKGHSFQGMGLAQALRAQEAAMEAYYGPDHWWLKCPNRA